MVREKPSLYWPRLKQANEVLKQRRRGRHPAGGPQRAHVVWQHKTFAGPPGEPLVWDVNNPPRRGNGWRTDGLLPGVDCMLPKLDRAHNGLLFDLNSRTPRPKALTLDYSFTQPVGTEYMFGVTVRYEGQAEGARINLGYSFPGYTEGDGRQIFRYINWVVYPEDKARTLWLPIGAVDEPRLTWVRLYIHPNPGKVWVSRIVLAPAQTYTLEGARLRLPAGEQWWGLDWELSPPDQCLFSVSIDDAATERALFARLYDKAYIGDLSRIYGIEQIVLTATCTVPAGQNIELRRLSVTTVPRRAGDR